ncbi:MAG: SMP-30/gluconolactonase/LRE family protein [Oculatellaceae cyanobacterium Prado106]|nr:SMP-30/gluconolactonase/LRE family protein [Oculatellaceae cyanobacterium Prado106]
MTHPTDAPTHSPQPILTVRARLGEGPCWIEAEQCLYWVDIYNHRVHRLHPATGEHRFFEVGEVVGCVAPAGNHRLILALRHRLAFLDTQTGEITPALTIEDAPPGGRFNDGKCDPAGRFWVGMTGNQKPLGRLYRYDPDGTLQILETGLTIPNGLGWSPDQKTFYLTDSFVRKIYAYDFDVERGSITDRRTWVNLSDETFEPDGLAIDQEGCIWSAMWNGWCIIRFDPEGREMTRIKLPVQRPTSCTFGQGQLYITTASVGLSEDEIQASFYSGDLFGLAVSIAGTPTHSFRQEIRL